MKLMHEVRGLRNNNCENLEKSLTITWNGEVGELPGIPEETRFCQFGNMDYGTRAIFRILKTYREKYGLNTIESIINRYAPPGENDSKSYILSLFKNVGVHPKQTLCFEKYPDLVIGIIQHENGFCPFTTEYIKAVFVWAVPEWHENQLNIIQFISDPAHGMDFIALKPIEKPKPSNVNCQA